MDFGNSFGALFFGRDDGEYFRATGADLTWRPPEGSRDSFRFRLYGERQSAVAAETDFALFRVFDGEWRFRPNLAADDVEEAGAELRVSPWWGNNPVRAQLGLELEGRGAMWRHTGDVARSRYGQAIGHGAGHRPRAAARAGGAGAWAPKRPPGTTWGDTLRRSATGSSGRPPPCADIPRPQSRAAPSSAAGWNFPAPSKASV